MDAEDLRRRRAALGISQEELARRLRVTRQSVYAWERGITGVPGLLEGALRYVEAVAAGRLPGERDAAPERERTT